MLQISMLRDEALLNRLQRAAFGYFLQTVNPLNGLVADTSRDNSPVSIAVVGFALASYPVAVERGWIERAGAKEMLAYQHSGFSLDAGVCIEAHDRAALERLLRYCARPPFAMDRLRKRGSALVYRCAKQNSEPTGDKRGVKVDELILTPLELIHRIAALVPLPRTNRHRYFGVLAPNSPLRTAVTAMAQPALAAPPTLRTLPAWQS